MAKKYNPLPPDEDPTTLRPVAGVVEGVGDNAKQGTLYQSEVDGVVIYEENDDHNPPRLPKQPKQPGNAQPL